MATPYSVIYERFLNKIQDFKLAELPAYDLTELCHDWLVSAISKFRKCKSDLSDRDDELAQFNVDLEDSEIEILSLMMAREWLRPQLNSVLLTSQFYGDKESSFYSQANHIAELRAMDESLKLEAQKLSRDWTYANSDYFSD